jgi:hypothetical protein
VKKETAEQLEAFRQQREAAEKALLDEAENQQRGNPRTVSSPDQETWATSGKKRRRLKEKDTLMGTKLRKFSSSADKDRPEKPLAEVGTEDRTDLTETHKEPTEPAEPVDVKSKSVSQKQSSSASRVTSKTSALATTTTPATSALGLGNYSSDED